MCGTQPSNNEECEPGQVCNPTGSSSVQVSVGPSSERVKKLAVNGVAVSRDHPVKSVAIDIADGAAATFALLRGGGTTPFARTSAGAPLPPLPAASSAALGGPPPPEAPSYPPGYEAPSRPPVEPPPPAPAAAESEDDILARRLEALKRS